MTVRVAAVQLAVGTSLEENLATCRRLLDAAAAEGAELVVLPEFCNHPSWYDDADHARAVAVRPGDDWLAGIAERARTHAAWVMVNATRLADDGRVFGSNFLFGPDGELTAVTDKQVLMGGESIHISAGEVEGPLVATPFGTVGLYSCMDGVINETPRALALRGARILCNSLNSFAEDEATLHVPVRAAENRVFVVAANKVGPLIPAHAQEEVATRMGIPAHFLNGAGESQVVAPDGTVLAIGPKQGEAVVVADLDPSRADDKRRPDGTDRWAVRRPSLYAPIAQAPRGRRHDRSEEVVRTAALGVAGDLDEVAEAVRGAFVDGARLVVLPELAAHAEGRVGDVDAAVAAGEDLVRRLAELAATTGPSDAVVVTAVVEQGADGPAHVGVAVGAGGVLHRQAQLHAVARHGWATALGDAVACLALPWGRLAIVVGDDHVQPEVVRLAALEDADVVAVPFDAQEPWEVATGLVERAAENRVCLAAATRPGPLGGPLACDLERDFTMWTTWEERAFDGRISHPVVTRAAEGGAAVADLHLAAAHNRVLTRATDVVDSRPWRLVGALVEPAPDASARIVGAGA